MSIFLEKVIVQSDIYKFHDILWHKNLPILAAISSDSQQNGQVFVFKQNAIAHDSPWKYPSLATCMAWHSSKTVLVIGFKSGKICGKICDSTVNEFQLPTIHNYPVHFISWVNENQLITTDNSGIIIIWNYSKVGNFQQLMQHELKDSPKQFLYFDASMPHHIYIGCSSGTVYKIHQDNPVCTEVAHLETVIQKMVHNKVLICILTNGGLVSVFEINKEEGTFSLLNKVKLNAKANYVQFTWIANRMLAIAAGDLSIRIWNCEDNDTYLLPFPESLFHPEAEYFTCMAFQKTILAACTNLGSVSFWRYNPNTDVSEEVWNFVGLTSLTGGSVLQSTWSATNTLCVHNTSSIYLIEQHNPCVVFRDQVAAIQTSSSVACVQKVKDYALDISVEFTICSMDLYGNHCLIFGENKIAIYQLNTESSNKNPILIGQFDCSCTTVRLYKQCCFCIEGSLIQMRSFQGSFMTSLSFMDSEGVPEILDITEHFLCAGSKLGFIKIWGLSNREPKLHINARQVSSDIMKGFQKFLSLKINSDGNCVSFSVHKASVTSNQLHVWKFATIGFRTFDVTKELPNSVIENHLWDEEEPRILLCQIKNADCNQILSLMISDESQEILVQDIIKLDFYCSLVGAQIPNYFVLDASSKIQQKKLDSLISLEQYSDKATRDALLSFGCHLRLGSVEKAYQAIRSFNSPTVWQSLAQYSVKLRRPDMGLICLGKLGNARAARAVRLAQQKYAQPEAVTAVLAIHLGMNEEAEELCQQANCYELLNKIYQASNQWEKSLDLAETKDRINWKQTLYDYARHLEVEGNVTTAKQFYEKCQTHYFDATRMLFEDSAALEEYCTSSNDPELLRWWAQYLESSGEMEAALQYYTKADDYLSLARLHCYLGDLDRAAELAEQSKNKAACFHVARQYEVNGNIQAALRLFAQAGAYGNAVRLCKEHNLEDQLYRYALQGDHEEQVEAARYFELSDASNNREPRYDRAVLLYSKAGLLDTALDLASRTNQHEAILEIARRLDGNANPTSLQRCATYLESYRHYDEAVNLLILAGKLTEAIHMCLKYNVRLQEPLADKLTATENNKPLLIQLAEVAQQQGDYQLAAKKFTQAGDRLLAMKALLKSGDTEKIVFFANVSRQKDVYILAANYLQTLDWRSHVEYVKHIVTFYTKAKAPDLLAGFYEACAQTEIDEYKNYESALNALKEAKQVLANNSEHQQSLHWTILSRKLEFIKQFIAIQNLMPSNTKEASNQLQSLLKSPDMELGILHVGNIYALMVEIYVKQEAFEEALNIINLMKANVPSLLAYLDQEVINNVCQHCNISPGLYRNLASSVSEDELENQEEIKEVIRKTH